MPDIRLKNQHLLWRAGFGPMAENIEDLSSISTKKLWELLVKTSADVPDNIKTASLPLTAKNLMNADAARIKPAEITKEQRQQMRKQSVDEIKNLNLDWLDTMVNSKAQLREKMSLFWHGHFACRVVNSFYSQELLNVIRPNALGSFATMLHAVSKSPAMLQFLNNQQNRKGRPNENFAREVMELFTLGRGNYTEKDIKESARAFTGWGYDANGNYVFRANAHDEGTKTFLGETGNFNGDEILDIILKNPQTARYITSKIFKYFVNETVDEVQVAYLSNRFFKNNYDIQKLLDDIYTSNWFYEPKNIGNKIKSPVELLVGIRRYLPLTLDNGDVQLVVEKVLGQVLFYPPNVAGWAGGKSWIDSSTLMVRLQLPQALSAKDAIDIRPKSDDDVNMGMTDEKRVKIGKKTAFATGTTGATIDWPVVNKNFEKTARPQLAQAIIDSLLQTTARINTTLLSQYLNNESRESFIKSVVINVMSTPEYQLC